MENQNEKSWLDEIFDKVSDVKDIQPDEEAIEAAGLVRPEDAELEQIIRETLAEDAVDDSTRAFDAPETAPEPEAEFSEEDEEEPVGDEEDGEDEEDNEPKTFWQKLWALMLKGDGLFGIPHLLSTVVWAILIIAIGTSLGRTLWLCAADVLALGKTGQEITVTVDIEDRLPDIADKLEKAGMVRYPWLFEQFARLTGKGNNILVGSITFNAETVYDYNALINAMSYKGGSVVTVSVMIPEGYACAQIFALLEEKGVCSAKALEQHAAEGELDAYWFLNDITRGHKYCLEGFLFPDTYEFYMDDDPRRVLEKFLDNFNYRFSQRMIDKFVALNTKTGLNLTLQEVIIMASIVEKEKAADAEGYKIASVFYNRLMNASTYPYLDSDATINYAIDYYNKGELVTDAQINASPYHTYKHPGLPPTPIANPGLASLDAALEPEDTNYYFFLLDRSAGAHRFSTTLAEHERLERELGYK
ncbi:MAG: endolytic transglycosylase MltG [Oscillospiraceae bacterium]|nr:endolytic transglycosylase MltG [Oscillospiraceae bacterium]